MKKFLTLLFITIISISSLSGNSLRIELNELKNNLTKYKILDVRDQKSFLKDHIEGAQNLSASLTYNNLAIDGKLTQPMTMQKLFRELGLNTKDHIVVYDEGSIFDASRVFWALEVYGFKKVKLLNGGYEGWKQLGYPLSKKILTPKKSNYIATINNKRLATKFTTQIATKNPNQVIIDARKYKAYIGKESQAQRYGHIPKAIHIPAIHNLDKQEAITLLKSSNELKKLYKDVDKKKKVVIYCTFGKAASTNYFVLRELGYNVATYDASWKEWGNDFTLPIVNKSKEKKEK